MKEIVRLVVTFNGDTFCINHLDTEGLSMQEFFDQTDSDALFVAIEQNTDAPFPGKIFYHLYDGLVQKDLRGLHVIIETDASALETKNLFILKSNVQWNNFGMLLKRNPKLIASLIQKLEIAYIDYKEKAVSVFSGHKDMYISYFGLMRDLFTTDCK